MLSERKAVRSRSQSACHANQRQPTGFVASTPPHAPPTRAHARFARLATLSSRLLHLLSIEQKTTVTVAEHSVALLGADKTYAQRRLHSLRLLRFQVKNLKTLGEALEVFTAEEVVSFKWDKEINAAAGKTLTQVI